MDNDGSNYKVYNGYVLDTFSQSIRKEKKKEKR